MRPFVFGALSKEPWESGIPVCHFPGVPVSWFPTFPRELNATVASMARAPRHSPGSQSCKDCSPQGCGTCRRSIPNEHKKYVYEILPVVDKNNGQLGMNFGRLTAI